MDSKRRLSIIPRVSSRRGRSLVRAALAALACTLIVFCVLISGPAAAQRRGGGFGGGRGGFSGGSSRSSGGFGGLRSSSSSYGGGYGGGYRSSYGPRFFFFGGGSGSGTALLVIFGVVLVVVIAVAANSWHLSRFAMVNVALNLRDGERYAKRLDGLVNDSDFTSASGRARALHRLCKLVEPQDVVEGFVRIDRQPLNKDQWGQKSEDLARRQMAYVGVEAEAVNVSNEEGRTVKIDAPANDRTVEDAQACVVVLLLTLRKATLGTLQSGDGSEAITALNILETLPGQEFDALYFFYAPNAAQPLDPHAANRIYLDLAATAA